MSAISVLAATTLAMMAALAPEAYAIPNVAVCDNCPVYHYTFANPTTLTFANSNEETVTGSFTVQILGTIVLLSTDITLTGPAPEADNYTIPVDATGSETDRAATLIFSRSGTTQNLIVLNFHSNLSGTIAPLFQAEWIHGPDQPIIALDAVGGATPTIPEPKTFTLLATAPGLFLLIRWAVRRPTKAVQQFLPNA